MVASAARASRILPAPWAATMSGVRKPGGRPMARCERGYLCTVCGEEVEGAADSALYLRYLLGEVAPEELPRRPECHVRCDAELAQYVVDPAFPPVRCEGPFGKEALDPAYT